MGVETHYAGKIVFTPAVDPARMPESVGRLATFGDLFSIWRDGELIDGIRVTDRDYGWAKSSIWRDVLGALTDIARAAGSRLATDMTWQADDDPADRGTLLVDDGDRFHSVRDDEDRKQHLSRNCRCYLSDADDDAFLDLPRTTDDPSVTVEEQTFGPFSEYAVGCREHGHEGTYTSRKQAAYRREQHLLQGHVGAGGGMSLGATPALDRLPESFREHVDGAVRALRQARTSPGAVRARFEAQDHAATARAAVDGWNDGDVLTLLVEALVETGAAAAR